jgi:phosphoribosyl 1,2-cyclic phosphodiesterase
VRVAQVPETAVFIFDCGSGVKTLGDWLQSQKRTRIKGKVFVSHPHWDHINALPFFAPRYIQGNEFEILGANQGDTTMRELISAQMDGVYFPITLTEFAARVYFHDLEEEHFEVDGTQISTMLLSHLGKCLGYRVTYNGRSVCYITDNELFLESSEFHSAHYEKKLIAICEGTDALITDCTYTDEEYETKVGWGHSCMGKVVELADRAAVKTLYLFHHDPSQMDSDIDARLETATKHLSQLGSDTKVVAPRERQTFEI